MECVALLSGGIDSSITMLRLKIEGWKIQPLFVNYGQRQQTNEWTACQSVSKYLKLSKPLKIDIPAIGKIHDRLAPSRREGLPFPHRNLLLAGIGALCAYDKGVGTIALGLTKSTRPFPDCTKDFTEKLQAALSESVGNPVEVFSPFIKSNKAKVVRFGLDRDFRFDLTYSCWRGGKMHCGECPACLSRRKAFADARGEDPTKYAR